ncbi:hypothetical protein [Prevotella aurantiaca]|nr:hypothetical protein [Prevotella aurantiaca]
MKSPNSRCKTIIKVVKTALRVSPAHHCQYKKVGIVSLLYCHNN